MKPQGEIRTVNAVQRVLPRKCPGYINCSCFRSYLIVEDLDSSFSFLGEAAEKKRRMVGKENVAEKGLEQGLKQKLYQNKRKGRQTKRKNPQKTCMNARIGRWKVKSDDTAIE